MLTALIIGAVGFADFLLSHIIVFHYRPPKKRFRMLMVLLVSTAFFYALVFWVLVRFGVAARLDALVPQQLMALLFGAFVYFFIWYFYAHLVVVFDRSVTPRMMIEVYTAPGKKLTFEGMKERYSMRDKFVRELDDMVYMGRIERKGDIYMNTPKGLTHAKVMTFLREYLHIGGHQ